MDTSFRAVPKTSDGRLSTSSRIGYLCGDLHDNITDANSAFLDMVGYSSEELHAGKLRWSELTPPEYAPLDAQALAQCRALGVCTPYEKEFVCKDGSRLPVLISTIDFDEEGDEVVCFVRERSLFQQARADRLRLAVEMRLWFESTDEGILGLDLEGLITFANPAAERLLGYALIELLGQNIHTLIQHSYPDGTPYPAERSPILGVLQKGEGCRMDDEALWRKDGTSFPAAFSAFPILKDGVIQGAVTTISDISTRKQAEADLRASTRQLAVTLESITDAFFSLDQEWRFTYVNPQAERLLSRTREELLGKIVWEDFPETIASLFGPNYRRAVSEQRTVSFEEYYPPLDAWFAGRVYPSSEGISVYFHDITIQVQSLAEQASAEIAVRESEEQMRAVVEHGTIGIFVFDPLTGHLLRTNAAVRTLLGYTEEEAAVLTLYDIIAHDKDSIDRDTQRIACHGEASLGERQYRCKDGSTLSVEVRLCIIHYSGKEACCAIVTDLTARKQAEVILEVEREFQRALLENLQEGIVACDASGTMTLVNRATRELHGLPAEPIPVERWAEHYSLFYADGLTPMQTADIPLLRALQGEKVVEAEVIVAPKKGVVRSILANGQALHDARGNKIGAVVALHDVTERKQFEDGQRLLVEAGTLLSATLDYEITLTSIARLAIPTLADLCFFDLLEEDGTVKRVAWAHANAQKQSVMDEAYGETFHIPPPKDTDTYPVSKALMTLQSEFVPVVTDEWMRKAATSPQHLAVMRQMACVSMMTVPLMARGAAIGTLTLGFAESGRQYTPFQLSLAQELCSQAALAVQNVRLYQAALDRADHDPLTELLNHRAFQKKLEDETARAQRENTSLAVVMLDLDNFKFFNDVYGHVVGDDVLRQMASRLLAICRPYDTIARFGGDEFALLLPGSGQSTPAEIEARMRGDLRDISFRPEGQVTAIPITVSVGVALLSPFSMDCHEALQRADERLLRSKTGGSVETEADAMRTSALTHVAGFSMLDALVTAVDNKDRYTRKHSEDVMTYSLMIARELGLDAAVLRTIGVAALLHDVGKIGIPDAILRKPGKLTDDEFEAIKQHPMMGAVMVGAVPGLEDTLDAVRHHHERWDGKGYPFGLRGEETPLMARLMAVADAFSAMTTDRPYRQGMPDEKALSILEAGAGSQWDPECIDAFLKALSRHPNTTRGIDPLMPPEPGLTHYAVRDHEGPLPLPFRPNGLVGSDTHEIAV